VRKWKHSRRECGQVWLIYGVLRAGWGGHWKVDMKPWRLLLALAVFIIPVRASDSLSALDGFPRARSEEREIHDETDPTDQQACYSMGQISLTYESGEVGPPSVGVRVTDPRGRKIGYDLRADKGWQELPLAQGFFDCDENEDTSELRHCAGHIQICGPISGTYKVEVLPAKSGKYSITVSSTSQETPDEVGFHSTDSRVELKSEIQKQAPEVLVLEYSREAGAQVKLTKSDQRVARGEKRKTEESSR
jgi:hypothetical protein